ncbi:hypothetical protein BH10PSE19_BH10PSE19_12180 [soil metagenome]
MPGSYITDKTNRKCVLHYLTPGDVSSIESMAKQYGVDLSELSEVEVYFASDHEDDQSVSESQIPGYHHNLVSAISRKNSAQIEAKKAADAADEIAAKEAAERAAKAVPTPTPTPQT